MAAKEGFTIELACDDGEWWRYNVVFTCGLFDREDRRMGFATAEDKVVEVGGEVTDAMKRKQREIACQTEVCDHVLAYLYIIPHTLPEDNEIKNDAFDIELKINYAGKEVGRKTCAINRWSGASLELKFGQKGW